MTHSVVAMRFLFLSAIPWAFTSSANAAFYDGRTLYQYCTSQTEADLMVCSGFVVAIVDTLTGPSPIASQPLVCMPKGVTIQDVRDIVTASLRVSAYRHLPATALSQTALMNKFPCFAH